MKIKTDFYEGFGTITLHANGREYRSAFNTEFNDARFVAGVVTIVTENMRKAVNDCLEKMEKDDDGA